MDESIIEDSREAIATLVRLFGELFEADDIDADSDFFELGGDSLMAATLMSGIEKEFGAVLSVSILLEGSTPGRLADLVSAALVANRPRTVVTANAEGNGLPLFCIHGMMGASLFPMRLANALDRARPVYGLRAVGLEKGEVPYETVAEMAAGYVRDIKMVQPSGPYLVLGQCGASFVALEVAQHLTREGSEVAALVLGDPPPAKQMAWRTRDPETLGIIIVNAGKRVQRAVERARDNPDLSASDRANLVSNALYGAIGAYVPVPYIGRTLLIHSSGRRGEMLLDPVRGFPRFLPNLKVAQVGTDHRSVFQSHVGDTAAVVQRFLDEQLGPI